MWQDCADGYTANAILRWGDSSRDRPKDLVTYEAWLIRTERRVVLLHYSPIAGTVEGEPLEIYPYLGSSRLEEPLSRYPVDVVFHGHAHHGTAEGRTMGNVPVYNVSMPLLARSFADRPPFRIFEVAAGEGTATQATPALARGRRATDAIAS